MNADQRRIEKILVQHLPSPSEEETASAGDRAWHRVQLRAHEAMQERFVGADVASSYFWRRIVMSAAAALVVFAIIFALQFHKNTIDAHAVVETGDGNLLEAGRRIDAGKAIRTSDQGALLSLNDGSRIEMRSKTELVFEAADDGVRMRLSKGGILINAAPQRKGHLYVHTKDVSVSVVGTVFLVNAEEEGSQVAVIEGEVLVRQGETTQNLLPGEQLLTGLRAESRPVVEEIAWSRSAEAHVALLQQTAAPSGTPRKRLEFDVASIRPIRDEDDLKRTMASLSAMSASGHFFGDTAELRCKGIDGTWSSQDRNVMAHASSVPMGRCLGVANLALFLRAIRDVDHPGVVGNDLTSLPKGIDRAQNGSPIFYQLNAKAEDPGKATKADLLEMLKNFAFDRLKLKHHIEKRIVDGWAVRIAPSGLKMKETSLDAEKRLSDVGQGDATAYRTTIQKFFSAMAPTNGLILHGPVIDMTGLTGKVFEFNWSPKIVPPLPGATGARGTVGGFSIPVPDYNPPLEKQLEEQLGLTIAKEKVPTQVLVVDHIEKPSEN